MSGESATESSRPSIIMIVLDAMRADCAPGAEASPHLLDVGMHAPALPGLSRLVEQATNFTQTYACGSYTPSCHGSLFTGLLPPEHGVRTFHSHALNDDVRTLASILVEAGYVTCGYSDTPWLLQRSDLWRGFQTIVYHEEDALSWWDAYQGAPKLLFLHLFDAHDPYGVSFKPSARVRYPAILEQWQERMKTDGVALPPQAATATGSEYVQRILTLQIAWQAAKGFGAALQLYIDGLVEFDRQRLMSLANDLRHRQAREECLLVVTADHAEGRNHTQAPIRMTHGSTVADDQLHIPLFIAGAGMPAGPFAEQASQADIMPTLLDLVGLLDRRTPPLTGYSGRSLLPLLRGEKSPERPVYAELFQMATQGLDTPEILRFRCLRYPQRKYRLVGRLLNIPDLLACPAEEFVVRLYRDLFARTPQPNELARALAARHGQDGHDHQWRRALIDRLLHTKEMLNLNKHAVYDLRRDPLELAARDPRRGLIERLRYRQQRAILNEIDARSRPSAPLIVTDDDSEIIEQRLRALGYLE